MKHYTRENLKGLLFAAAVAIPTVAMVEVADKYIAPKITALCASQALTVK